MDEQNQSTSGVNPEPETSAPSSTPPTPQQQNPSVAPVASSSPVSATPPAPPQPVPPVPPSAQPQRSGSRFIWIIILVALFFGFLALAMWYFHSQLLKTTAVAPTTAQTAISKSATSLLLLALIQPFSQWNLRKVERWSDMILIWRIY